MGLLAGLLPIVGAVAQSVSTDEPEFVVKVLKPEGAIQRVKVPLNRSIIIETSIPCSRVDVVGEETVRVEAVSPNRLLIVGQQYGMAQVVVWTAAGQRNVIEVSVVLDLELLNATIKEMDPQSDARAISILGDVLLIGTVSSAEVAEQVKNVARLYTKRLAQEIEIENQLRIVGEQQVLLRCVVAEVSRSAIRELGINGFLAGENFRDGFVVSQVGAINPINIQAAPAVNVQTAIPFITGAIPITGNTTFSLGFPDVQMQLFIRAMADNTLLRILAEPTLVAVSGETARFRSGGEFPVPVPQSGQAAGAITIEFKEFGVNLDFTPLVLPHQRIRLHVRPVISARDETGGLVTPSGFVPAIIKREVETTVEMASGSTIAIAGLLQDEIRGIATRIPGIGNLPILGSLFRSVSYQRSRTELVILVTPEIIAPMMPSQVPEVPGERITDPTDLEVYLLGAIEGPETWDDIELPADAELQMTVEQRSWPSEPDRLSVHGPWGYADPGKR